VAEARGGVAEVEATGEELVSGVMPPALDVELQLLYVTFGNSGQDGKIARISIFVPRTRTEATHLPC